MFDTVEEAQQKISQTVVMYGDDPVFVVEVGGRAGRVTAHVRSLGDDMGVTRAIALSDPLWDVKTLGNRLGYINLEHRGVMASVYSRRIHIRRAHQTQGLSNTNVYLDQLKAIPDKGIEAYTYRFSTIHGKFMKETLQQKYPSLSKIKYMMAKNDSLAQIAFDPCLAVSKDFKGLWKLNYKGKEIGWTDDLEVFRIPSEWRYLDNRFDECGMKVRN